MRTPGLSTGPSHWPVHRRIAIVAPTIIFTPEILEVGSLACLQHHVSLIATGHVAGGVEGVIRARVLRNAETAIANHCVAVFVDRDRGIGEIEVVSGVVDSS